MFALKQIGDVSKTIAMQGSRLDGAIEGVSVDPTYDLTCDLTRYFALPKKRDCCVELDAF